ncbi:hypothetical protein [Campylobacter helveticus]|uniref:hypothetical protein n=1 Tax=Campylobacter helveticus TaxID=28898 RepID=UPI0022EA8BFC|nr:hypothetical protein [Campylobacter helveticus]
MKSFARNLARKILALSFVVFLMKIFLLILSTTNSLKALSGKALNVKSFLV